jgi:hypothetical protein
MDHSQTLMPVSAGPLEPQVAFDFMLRPSTHAEDNGQMTVGGTDDDDINLLLSLANETTANFDTWIDERQHD